MKVLPLKSLNILISFVLFLFVFASNSLAASAYISPASGFIREQTFLVSLYVESSTSEPAIAGANIKLTYPSTVTVKSISEGEFDSYLEKTNDTNTRTITINALNNAGSYKSGKVKLAALEFNATANTGQVQLTITGDSGISGEGGEQLLTETINGVYTIDIQSGTTTTTTTTTTTSSDGGTGSGTAVPNTGSNDFLLFLVISIALISLGLISFTKPKFFRR